MTPERWADVDRVWHAVLARPEHERAAAVEELCAGDAALRHDVDSLLANLAGASAAGFGAAPGVPAGGGSLVGHRLGSYTVRALLGVGGMGEVYRAHDSTLGREVALKVLPELWLADSERRARFDREARLLASLNHPNIGAIYGVHESDPATSAGLAVKALVLELVEGETLADRIGRQAGAVGSRGLPLADVTSIAAQIAEALEAAHERGVIHRDLKPGNIKITPEGRVKVLDFGLARAMSEAGAGGALTHSPTMTVGGTRAGVLLGTAPYMSPEQARGQAVDERADIWAFGCVLYEMLTGVPAFRGDGVTDVLANVLKSEPEWTRLPADTPATLRVCLHRCLQKELRQRFRDIADARLAMEGAFELPAGDGIGQPGRPRHPRLAYAGWFTAALVTLAAAVGIVLSTGETPAELPETRLEIVTPSTTDPASLAISPDGRRVVFSAGPGPLQLWLRPLESGEARLLMGTAGGVMPFWSPDGQSIGFFADGALKRIDLAAGFVRTLASAPQPRRGAWNSEGTIVFGAGSVGPLYRVSADGSGVQEATRLLPGQTNHRWPQFLPDGRQFLLYTLGAADARGVYLGSLADTTVRRVSDREAAYAFMAPGHLLFARQGALWARKLSAEYISTEGELMPVAPKVLVSSFASGFGAFSSSATGSIAYRASAGENQLVWVDRSGRSVAALGQPADSQMGLTHLSSDGRTAAVMQTVDGNPDVWLVDTERGVSRRLTVDPGDDGNAVLSPDGSRTVYVADGKADVYQIHERPSDGTGDAQRVFESDENKNPSDWSPDGRYLLYASQSLKTDFDLWALPLVGDRKPFEVARTPFLELDGRFSPDGRWVAYVSSETGRPEIYVQPFPGPGPKSQVSFGGGFWPRWQRDGRELFFLAPDNRLMAVSLARSGSSLQTGPPRALFMMSTTSGYEPSPDGQRFLVTAAVSEASPISVILNWKPPVR